jgi:hypothetical protein
VVVDAAVHRRYAHLVAVVLDAGDYARRYQPGVEAARRHRLWRGAWRPEAQHVGSGDGPRRDAHHVAYHASDSGVGAAERLDRRGVVVRLDLERYLQLVVEFYYAGVVDEGRQHPGGGYLVGGFLDVAFKDVVHERRIAGAALGLPDLDQGLEGLVDAVLAPGLGHRLELGVGAGPVFVPVVVTYGAHLDQVERCTPLSRQRKQGRVVHGSDVNHFHGT